MGRRSEICPRRSGRSKRRSQRKRRGGSKLAATATATAKRPNRASEEAKASEAKAATAKRRTSLTAARRPRHPSTRIRSLELESNGDKKNTFSWAWGMYVFLVCQQVYAP